MTDDTNLKDISEQIYQMAGEMIKEGQKPFAVAAVFAMIALQIYKTSLSEEDYNKMVDEISSNRNRIKSLNDVASVDGKLH